MLRNIPEERSYQNWGDNKYKKFSHEIFPKFEYGNYHTRKISVCKKLCIPTVQTNTY